MSRMIFCTKYQKEAEGLESAPIPGPLGERVYQEISREAWQHWLAQQTILINEHRLNLRLPEARAFLLAQLERFLFNQEN